MDGRAGAGEPLGQYARPANRGYRDPVAAPRQAARQRQGGHLGPAGEEVGHDHQDAHIALLTPAAARRDSSPTIPITNSRFLRRRLSMAAPRCSRAMPAR